MYAVGRYRFCDCRAATCAPPDRRARASAINERHVGASPACLPSGRPFGHQRSRRTQRTHPYPGGLVTTPSLLFYSYFEDRWMFEVQVVQLYFFQIRLFEGGCAGKKGH